MRKICFFTGTRAEYGLLRPLMEAVRSADNLKLQLIVSGAHLAPEFGMTVREIEADGFFVDERVEMLLSSDTAVGTCNSMGLGMIGTAGALQRLTPDILVVLGDRFETFAAACAASICGVPIAHLHGGEITEGAFDDSLRHAITKMSHLHFTATETYRARVVQLGEEPDRVFNVGSIGVASARQLPLLDKTQLEQELGFVFGRKSALVTFHPVTREDDSGGDQLREILTAFEKLPDLQLLFTGANADAGGREINALIHEFVLAHPERSCFVQSLGQLRYFSALRQVSLVVGNSSSGLIEAPSFGLPVVNIGDRQRGRVKAANVIDCEPLADAIEQSCLLACSDAFQQKAKSVVNPYEQKNPVARIIEILQHHDTFDRKKRFHDLPEVAKTQSDK